MTLHERFPILVSVFLWQLKGALPTEKLGQNDESRDSGRWLDLGGVFVFVCCTGFSCGIENYFLKQA